VTIWKPNHGQFSNSILCQYRAFNIQTIQKPDVVSGFWIVKTCPVSRCLNRCQTNLNTVRCRYPDESGYQTGILGYNRIFVIRTTNHAAYHIYVRYPVRISNIESNRSKYLCQNHATYDPISGPDIEYSISELKIWPVIEIFWISGVLLSNPECSRQKCQQYIFIEMNHNSMDKSRRRLQWTSKN
jgi:hypothetical protein